MATPTARCKFLIPAAGELRPDVPLIAIFQALERMAALAELCVTPHEQPSTTLAVDFAAGHYVKTDGTLAVYAGASNVAVSASASTYFWLDGSGLLQAGAAWPTTGGMLRLAVVTTDSAKVTSIVDCRHVFVMTTATNPAVG